MKYKNGKIFRNENSATSYIEVIEYNPSEDYYLFIKKHRSKGFSQVIISSEIMIDILKEYFYEKKCTITSIELLENDEYMKSEIDQILIELRNDRGYFNLLLEKIEWLIDKNSIDLRKIEFSWRESKQTTSFFIQVNGILGITDTQYESEIENFIKLIECKV